MPFMFSTEWRNIAFCCSGIKTESNKLEKSNENDGRGRFPCVVSLLIYFLQFIIILFFFLLLLSLLYVSMIFMRALIIRTHSQIYESWAKFWIYLFSWEKQQQGPKYRSNDISLRHELWYKIWRELNSQNMAVNYDALFVLKLY